MYELVLTSKEAWSKRRICSEQITMIQQFNTNNFIIWVVLAVPMLTQLTD